MAVNAKDLPSLFTASTWTSNHVVHDAQDKWVASNNGLWELTTDTDGFRVSEANFNLIMGATVQNGGAGPFLTISGETREVYGFPSGGVRWIGLREPEE